MPPTQDQPAPVVNNVWGSQAPQTALAWTTLPSGQTCQYRRIGLEELVAAGVMPEIDALTPLIESGPIANGQAKLQGHKKKAKAVQAEQEASFSTRVMGDPTVLHAIITLADKVIPYIVIDPVVRLHYVRENGVQRMLGDDERDPLPIVYTDMIDLIDKMKLVELGIGDLTALAQFRGATETAVGGMESRTDV